MVSLLLGMVVMAGVVSVFTASQRVDRASRALVDVQDSARIAFELLVHDIRNAGLTACGNRERVANVLDVGPANGGKTWWADWSHALRGYGGNDADAPAGNATGDRVAGTPSLQVLRGDDTSFSVAAHDPQKAVFTLGEANTDPAAADLFIACDYDHAAIFRSSTYSAAAKTVGHAMSAGNCAAGLGYPTSCGAGDTYAFEANALLTRLYMADWYIGRNPDKGLSLYRLGSTGGKPARQEMVRGVTAMQVAYHQEGLPSAFVEASHVTQWNNVTAVRVTLTTQGAEERAGVNDAPIARQFSMTTTLRNRVP